MKEKVAEGADPGVNADGTEGSGTGGGSDADADPEAAADNSSNCGDSCGGASSSAVEAGRDVGSGHSGAPSKGKVEQGVKGPSGKGGVIAVAGMLMGIACPACALFSLGVAASLNTTADTPAKEGTAEHASRAESGNASAAFAPMAGGGGTRKVAGALSDAAKKRLKKDLDDIGEETLKQLDGGATNATKGASKGEKGAGKAFDSEEDALVQMAKGDKKTGMTRGDMEAYKELNRGLDKPFPSNKVRGPEAHPGRGHGSKPHGHVGPVNHIPIVD